MINSDLQNSSSLLFGTRNRKARISVEAFGVLSILILTAPIHMWAVNSVDYNSLDTTIILLNIWSAIVLVVLTYAIYRQAKTFNFMSVWILVAFLFYFGQYYCYPLGFSEEISDNRWSLFSGERNIALIIHTFFYALESIIIIVLFYIFSFKKNGLKSRKIVNIRNLREINNHTRKISKAIVLICLLPTLIYKGYAIYCGITFDYATMKYLTGAGMQGTIKYISYFSGWLMPVSYMWLAATDRKSEQNFIKVLLFVYAVMVLISGSRYEALEVACAYIIIESFFLSKNRQKLKVTIILMAVSLLFVFAFSRFVRIYGNAGGETFGIGAIFKAVFGDSAPAASINFAVIDYENKYHEYMYGLTYLYGFLSVLISPIRNVLFPNMSLGIGFFFSEYLGVFTTSLGASVIAEAFYNFGWFSLIIIMPVLGSIFGKIVAFQRKDNTSSEKAYNIGAYAYLCSLLLFSIRSDLSSIIRTYIVYAIAPIMIINIIASISKRK